MLPMTDLLLPRFVSRSQLAGASRRGFAAKVPEPALEWMPQHVRFPQAWESNAFDLSKMPHVRGFVERFWLDPTKRKANLPWSVRSGKTTTLLSVMAWVAVNDPAPMGILFPDRQILNAALTEHIYPMLERTRPIARQLLPRHKRNTKAIVLRDCRVRLANAGTLSDSSGWPARYIFKFEHDKCPNTSRREADASRRIESRTAGYARGVKIVEEGSPGKVSESRAARLLKSKTVQQVRYQVPCPHCSTYQQLKFEQLDIPREALDDLNAMQALRESRYHCSACDAVIEDHHRTAMMQAGRWVIVGEYVDAAGQICGVPDVDSDTMVFGEYNALYSLFVESFGVVAKEFVEAREAEREGDVDALMKFYTEVLAQPWDDKPVTVQPSELAVHLRGTHQRKELPAESAFLVTSADVGLVEEDLVFHWMVSSWWRGAQGAIVDWGLSVGVLNFLEWAQRAEYPLQGRPEVVLPVADFPVAIDSGKFSDDVYGVADSLSHGVAIKGDSRKNGGGAAWTYPGTRAAGQNPKLVAMKKKLGIDDLVMINSELTQGYRISVVSRRKHPGFAGHVVFPADVCDDWEANRYVFDQLQADHKVGGKWERTGPNEAGDLLRYCRAMAQRHMQNGLQWKTVELPVRYLKRPAAVQTESPSANVSRRRVRGGGRFAGGSFLISNRK